MNIKLSICIATLNRGDFIGETLDSIVAQSDAQIEIVVLDGGSTDDTEQVVRGFQTTFPQLHYIRQAMPHGVDRDFNTAVEAAKGEYCWLMPDDDLLKPGAIDAVLRACERRFDLILVNAEVRTCDFKSLLVPNLLGFSDDRSYAPMEIERLFEDTAGYLSYIGAVVIRKEVWLARDRASYFGSYFVHFGVIFQAPLPGNTLALGDPLISIRYGNAQWRPKKFEIWMFRRPDLIRSLTAISDAVKAKCFHLELWRSPQHLLAFRAKGSYGLTEYRRWIRPLQPSTWDRIKAIAVACVPGVVANLTGLLYCALARRNVATHLHDLKASRYYFANWLRKS